MLTAIILTLNEENILAQCLDGLRFVDKIIVVDSGSTDKTIDVAEQFGAVVYTRILPTMPHKGTLHYPLSTRGGLSWWMQMR